MRCDWLSRKSVWVHWLGCKWLDFLPVVWKYHLLGTDSLCFHHPLPSILHLLWRDNFFVRFLRSPKAFRSISLAWKRAFRAWSSILQYLFISSLIFLQLTLQLLILINLAELASLRADVCVWFWNSRNNLSQNFISKKTGLVGCIWS